MRIQFHADRCHGHQMCAIAAPGLFGSDDYGNALVLVEGDLNPDQEARARKACNNCPEHALELV